MGTKKSGFRGVNKVIIVGIVGRQPEVRETGSGEAVCNVSLATNEFWTDKSSGEQKTRAEWHRVVMFKRLAEIGSTYVKKGSKVYIEGSLRTSSYEKDGEVRYSTQVIANTLELLGNGNGRQAEPEEADEAVEDPAAF